MNTEDLELLNNLKNKVKGIALIDKGDFVLCLVHFNNKDNSLKFYYLFHKYEYDFILKENIDFKFDLCIHFKGTTQILISSSSINKINHKPLRLLINDKLPLKITSGINLDNGSYLELGDYLDVSSLLLSTSKSSLN